MSGDNKKPLKTPFVAGNRFWKARSSHGRNPIFESPEQLWGACEEYFEWAYLTPLIEIKLVTYLGNSRKEELPKMRAMTIAGLCNFLDISQETWRNYREKPDFIEVVNRVEDIIRDQKFSGAAAELLNPNIIARDLGLRDRVDSELSGSLDLTKLTDEELDAKIRERISKLND
jgi:hypothetical protein